MLYIYFKNIIDFQSSNCRIKDIILFEWNDDTLKEYIK